MIKYNNTTEAIARVLNKGDVQSRFGTDDKESTITFYDGEVVAGEISWNVAERTFSFDENHDPRFRRTGSVHKVLDALRKDLYLDDFFGVSVFDVSDSNWNQYDGVKAVIEVRDGVPKLVDIRHKGIRFIEEYDEEEGSNYIKEVIKTNEEISEEEFFKRADEILNQPEWYQDRVHTENLKVLKAYRSGSFNLKDFYAPIDGPRDVLDGTTCEHGGHWQVIQKICTEGFAFTDSRISDHTPWYRKTTDADRMKYFREHPEYHIDIYNDVWLVKNDIFGVRRRRIDKNAK